MFANPAVTIAPSLSNTLADAAKRFLDSFKLA
jgi:hypothetical protein